MSAAAEDGPEPTGADLMRAIVKLERRLIRLRDTFRAARAAAAVETKR